MNKIFSKNYSKFTNKKGKERGDTGITTREKGR